MIGVIVLSFSNGVFDQYVGAIQEVLEPAGFQVIVINGQYSPSIEEKAIETLLGFHPDAMILAGADQTARSRKLLAVAGLPVVQTMDLTSNPIDLNIGLDHREAGAAVVRFLHGKGHRKIAHLTGPTDPRARRRHEGYQSQMQEFGLPTAGLVGVTRGESDVAMGGKLIAELLDSTPDITAVFSCNDYLALGALFECQRRRIDVPGYMAIVGFNDLDIAAYSVPSLTTVSTERRDMGTWAARSVLGAVLAGDRPIPPKVDLGFEIMERGSTA